MVAILYIMELRRSVFLGPFRILRGVPYSYVRSVFLEAFKVVHADIGQFLSPTLRSPLIHLNCATKPATFGAGAEKIRKEIPGAAIFPG